MRKHRLFGVVIAVFIGLGALTHRSDTPHRTFGTDSAGIQLTSAEFSAHHSNALVHNTIVKNASGHTRTTVATNASSVSPDALLRLEKAHSGPILPFPFGAVQLVTDFRVATAREATEVNAYLSSVAQERIAVNAYLSSLAKERVAIKAYLASVAPRRPTPPPPPAPRPAPSDPWSALRQCESGGRYTDNTGNGYYGAYQFTAGTWASLGFPGLPSQAPAAQQDQAAQELQARRGWGQWPSCARRLGLI